MTPISRKTDKTTLGHTNSKLRHCPLLVRDKYIKVVSKDLDD